MSSASPSTPLMNRCPKCSQPLILADKIWNMATRRFVRVYKCRCGELVWDD